MGTYRNSEQIIAEISKYKGEYKTDKQIQELLKLPHRTYYYYLKQWREQISDVLKQRDKSHIESEIQRAKEGIEQDIQELTQLVKEAEETGDKIAAIKERKQARIDLIRLEHEGPEVVSKHGSDSGQSNNREQERQTASATRQ